MSDVTTIDEAIAAVAPGVLERMNEFDDSLLFVARVLGDAGEATMAEAVGVDATGVDLVLSSPTGEHRSRIDFAERVTDADLIGTHLIGLVTLARERSGEDGATSVELELGGEASIGTFLTTVSAVERVHPHLVRITLAGGDLTDFAPLGPDTYVFVLLPPEGRRALTIGRDFTWEGVAEMPEADRPVGAYYTVRAWRPDRAELDLLFVLHDPAGPASAWAERAAPGDPVALWGPRDGFRPPEGTSWYLLVADDTGLPAVAVILETLPPGTRATVVAEVDSEAEHQALPSSSGIDVRWVHRDGAPPGTVADRMLDIVRALPLPTGSGYAWGGGESRAVTAVRTHLRGERGMAREQVSMTGYWRLTERP